MLLFDTSKPTIVLEMYFFGIFKGVIRALNILMNCEFMLYVFGTSDKSIDLRIEWMRHWAQETVSRVQREHLKPPATGPQEGSTKIIRIRAIKAQSFSVQRTSFKEKLDSKQLKVMQ